ncbi:MAG: hypothetical protein QXV75_08070 [Candidatus Bathyarchaeia archaeon]
MARAIFVNKLLDLYIVVEDTGEQYYNGSTINIPEGYRLICASLIQNVDFAGECGLFVYDTLSSRYVGQITKYLNRNEYWLASTYVTLPRGRYVLEFHAVHYEDGRFVVDDTSETS